MDEQNKTSADVLIEFLKAAGNSGSVVKQLEELKNQIQMLEDLKLENKNYDQMISSKLKALKEIEHNLNNKEQDLGKQEEKFLTEKAIFESEKFNVKQKVEYSEKTLAAANDKIGEAEAKLKRLELEQSRIASMMGSAIEQKKKLDEAVKQISKIVSEI